MHSTSLGRLVKFSFVSLTIIVPTACAAPTSSGNDSVNHAWTKVVRGVNQTACIPANIGNGNDPSVGPKEDLTNLSVSCSADKKVTFQQLRAPLQNNHACRTTIGALRKQNRYVAIVADPIDGNPYHCLLSDITPNQFVQGAKYWD